MTREKLTQRLSDGWKMGWARPITLLLSPFESELKVIQLIYNIQAFEDLPKRTQGYNEVRSDHEKKLHREEVRGRYCSCMSKDF